MKSVIDNDAVLSQLSHGSPSGHYGGDRVLAFLKGRELT